LAALASAHDLLTIERWNRAALRDIVDRALQPFQERHGPTRLLISGPEEVWLDAQKSSLLTMALHELATNAVKYGALSNERGVVLLQWEKVTQDDEQRVRIAWSEIGGPPVAVPERKGFGSFLVERAIQGGGGSAQMDFRPDGLVCALVLIA
jgi:two-component sensor histidine kinase